MKYALFALFAALPMSAAAQVTKDDIKKLSAAGVSEDVILTYVRANGGSPRMSADDLVELKKAGVGERVLNSLAGATTAPAPAPAVVEKPVYVPQTTYVYSSAPSSSYWCSSHYAYDGCDYYYRPVVYSSWYPRTYYSGWGYPYYRSSYYYGSYCRPRVGISVGWRW